MEFVLDATKVTRTAAALVLGCQHLDPEVRIAGVILNQVAGKRHEQVLRGAIERYCQIPVLGVVPKESRNFFPERHLGLVPPQEAEDISGAVEYAAARMNECIDLDALWKIASTAEPLGWPAQMADLPPGGGMRKPVTIGVVRDSAFQFYYPENIEALEERGAIIAEVNSLDDRPLPDLDALYIGGGFPETHLEVLSRNEVFRKSLKDRIEAGLPVYAECGGLMFLCRAIVQGRKTFPMTGIFPFDVVLEKKPQGHGYTVMECVRENAFLGVGQSCKGHEFHYSRIVGPPADFPFVFRLKKGHGVVAGWDGMCYKNVLASYSHIHAVGHDCWAEALVCAAVRYRQEKTRGSIDNEWTHEVCREPVIF